jgi:hypothetical protein
MANNEEKKYLICDEERPRVAMGVKVMLDSVNTVLDRRDRIRDRNVKLTLLVDKLCLATDVLNGAVQTLPEKAGFERELCDDIRNTVARLREAMNELFEFVQDPNAPVVAPSGGPVIVNRH